MLEKIYKDKKNRDIRLENFDDFGYVSAYYDDMKIGSFSFDLRDNGLECCLLVVGMHLEEIEGFKRCGIGTAIIDWVEGETGWQVVFGRNDGFKSEDGSHLTENGPAFADYIRKRRHNS